MDKRVVKPFQRGVALIIALIMLTAMMMAGIALFRKITAGSMIAGNLTFTSSAISAAEQGSEAGRTWLTSQTGAGLYGTAVGYFPATCYTNDTHIATDVNCNNPGAPTFDPSTFDWTSFSTLATANDGAGNEIRYVVHRLCRMTGELDKIGQECVVSQVNTGSGGKSSVTYGTQALSSIMKPYYRITTRVRGPRNSLAYTQVTMY
jgi:Tfp pilus assembly protein PilX